MEIEDCINQKKDLYDNLLDFINTPIDYEAEYQSLIDIFEEQEIFNNLFEIEDLLQLISKIIYNQRITADFLNKLEMILNYFLKEKNSSISDFKIFKIFESNKRILFHLFDKKIIKPNESILKSLKDKKCFLEFKDFHFLYPTIKSFIEEKEQKEIEDEITQKYNETMESFEEKCRIGENDSYISSLIREDFVEEFIYYVNKTNLSLLTEIKPSIFETNPFLIGKQPNLIEYAAFFGSIQIIQYLKYNKVEITETLWCYAIHSNNAELIHFLEENNDNKTDSLYMIILKESIKCHHNNIADYIKDNLLTKINMNNFKYCILESCNYFYPIDIDFIISNPKIKNGINMNNLCHSLEKIFIPTSVTSIGDYCFEGCSNLKVISIHSSVKSFGIGIFQGIKNIEIKGSIKSIPDKLFENNSFLEKIIINSNSISSIGNYAFSGCYSLVEIEIHSPINSIGNCAFEKCLSLIDFQIPPSVTSIQRYTFSGCSSLKYIDIPSSVTSIGFSAFEGCSSLIDISLPHTLISIGIRAFDGCCSLKQILIPPTVTKIGSNAFSACSSLSTITIPDSVTSIGFGAFSECSSLTEITLHTKITKNLDSIFPNGVKITYIY